MTKKSILPFKNVDFWHTFSIWNNCLIIMNFEMMILTKMMTIWYSKAILYFSIHLISRVLILWMMSSLFFITWKVLKYIKKQSYSINDFVCLRAKESWLTYSNAWCPNISEVALQLQEFCPRSCLRTYFPSLFVCRLNTN